MASKKQRLRNKVNISVSKKKQTSPKKITPPKSKKNNQKRQNVKKKVVNVPAKARKIETTVQKEEPKKIKTEEIESNISNTKEEKNVNKQEIKQKKKEIKKLEKELKEQSKKNKKLSKDARKKAKEELKQTKKELKKEKKKLKKQKPQKEKKQKVKEQPKEEKEVTKKTHKRKNMYILFFLLALVLIALFVIGLFRSNNKIFFNFKAYKIGDQITLDNDSTWYAIEDSGIEKQDILLLSSNIVDINGDKKIDDKDKIAFDSDNQTEYTTKNDSNVGYFLREKGKELIGISDAKEIRLLKSEEYIKIRRAMDFGYDWKEGNWLANKDLKKWWLETTKYNMIYVVNEKGSYKLSSPNSKNFLRVVIKINKSKIKQN